MNRMNDGHRLASFSALSLLPGDSRHLVATAQPEIHSAREFIEAL
jgi:hypothetical protein